MRTIITLLICLLIGSINGGCLMAQGNIKVPSKKPARTNVHTKKKPARKNNRKKPQRNNRPQRQAIAATNNDSVSVDSAAVSVDDEIWVADSIAVEIIKELQRKR